MTPASGGLWAKLACPRDGAPVARMDGAVVCAAGHRYPVVDDVPVMLVPEMRPTHWVATRALAEAARASGGPAAPRGADASRVLGDAPDKGAIRGQGGGPAPGDHDRGATPGAVDAFVQEAIGATNGIMYRGLAGALTEYPVPRFRGGAGDGRWMLDVGCSWGRWSLAAARAGYHAIGIDPSLDAVRAARRVAAQLGVDAAFLVGDARCLPFADGSFDLVFSYSVLQHLGREDVRQSLSDIRRVLVPGGRSLVQMPNRLGARCLYHQLRRGFREARAFEVRYWSAAELRAEFEAAIGPAALSVDGFFSLDPQVSDAHLLPLRYRLVVRAGERLRHLSARLPWLARVADSLYVECRRAEPADRGAAPRGIPAAGSPVRERSRP
jgi:SAM-dependent methyltransferase/uncharacterized protein YbaR (Trm112 family)